MRSGLVSTTQVLGAEPGHRHALDRVGQDVGEAQVVVVGGHRHTLARGGPRGATAPGVGEPAAARARRTVRNSRCAVITSASQARPRVQATSTSVIQWWPRKTRLRPIARANSAATVTVRSARPPVVLAPYQQVGDQPGDDDAVEGVRRWGRRARTRTARTASDCGGRTRPTRTLPTVVMASDPATAITISTSGVRDLHARAMATVTTVARTSSRPVRRGW